MLLGCPWCGPRELEEFRFRTVVTNACAATADPASPAQEASSGSAYARVYERENMSDASVEYWQHERGCRAWLVVRRNPSTARIVDVRLLAGSGSAQS